MIYCVALAVLITIYIVLKNIEHNHCKNIEKCRYNWKYLNLLYIPIILLAIYIVYSYSTGEEKLKANMISVSRKLGKDIDSDELKIIENMTENCKKCAKDFSNSIVLAQDFTKQTGNSALENYFRDKLKGIN
jgi:hypothetical protein